MKKNMQKIAACCLIGTIAWIGNATHMKAAEIPIAGIDMVLSDFYDTETSSDVEINELLSPYDSMYKDLAIAQVNDYVNIRSKASEESKILGKLYNNSAATILEEKGNWVKVKSGSVTGYIKSEYLVTGEKVEELAKTVGKRIATVTTTTLKVREKAGLNATVETLVPIGEELNVKKEQKGWVKVKIDSDVIGYVSSDYVELRTEFAEAESIEEEKARLEEEARREAARAEAENQESERTTFVATNESNDSNETKDVVKEKPSSSSGSSSRSRLVDYALRFQGNPYVWGGTSLTNGADCSGFTQSVFRDNGISIPRTSRTQATGGRTISISEIQPGDLIFYDRNGTINHVAIYIGNGKVIGASNPENGIRISNYTYRQPFKVVSYMN
jgi:cell wall-associated NlpC family hydrolase